MFKRTCFQSWTLEVNTWREGSWSKRIHWQLWQTWKQRSRKSLLI